MPLIFSHLPIKRKFVCAELTSTVVAGTSSVRGRTEGRNAQGRRPCRQPVAAGDRSPADEGDSSAAAYEHPQRRVDQAAGRPGGPLFSDAGADVRRYDVEMKWKFFLGASILSVGLLFKLGAPLVPVAIGLAAAAFLTWKKQRSE